MTSNVILHIDTESGLRGGERQVLALMRGLRKSQLRQVLVTRRESELAAEAEADGIEVERLSYHAAWDPRTGMELRKLCRRHQPALVHAHTGNAHTLALKASRASNPPLPVVVTRRVDFSIKNNAASRRKYLAPNMHYIAISRGVRDVLVSGSVDADKIDIVPSGIDPNRFLDATGFEELRKEWKVLEPGPVFGTVGSYVDHKDPLNLIAASAEVLKELPNALFVFIGDGELRTQMEDLIDELSIKPNVILTGWQEDVGPFLRALDVFVMPSKLEGLCTSLLDAQAMGLPCVACSAGGMPDIITNGENGLLVPPMNSGALAKAMIQLWRDQEQREAFSQRGPRVVEERFTIDKMVQGTLQVYRRLMG